MGLNGPLTFTGGIFGIYSVSGRLLAGGGRLLSPSRSVTCTWNKQTNYHTSTTIYWYLFTTTYSYFSTTTRSATPKINRYTITLPIITFYILVQTTEIACRTLYSLPNATALILIHVPVRKQLPDRKFTPIDQILPVATKPQRYASTKIGQQNLSAPFWFNLSSSMIGRSFILPSWLKFFTALIG